MHRAYPSRSVVCRLALAGLLWSAVLSAAAQEVVEPLPPVPFVPIDEPPLPAWQPDPTATPPLAVASGWDNLQSSVRGVGMEAMGALPTTIAAGRTPATFAVSNAGAATYTIPLWSPAGVGEVQLKLALTYSSRGGNGVLGQGWSLSGLSAITRCNKTWAQDAVAGGVTNATGDRLCLDGQQLKLVSGTPGMAGAIYATEIESFSRIVANGPQTGGGPASFTVTTKNGLVYEYGTTTDSKIFAGNTGTIRTWALSRIRDRAQGATGNRIDLAYTNEAQNGNYTNGSHRIASITYPTTTTGQGPFYQVLFGYVPRPATDVPSGYLAGFVVREPNELSTITIQNYGAATPIKTYNLGYDTGTASSRRRLRTVQECSAASCFPATTITYQNGQAGWGSFVNLTGVTASTASGVGPVPIDLNGDGRSDLVYPQAASSTTSRWWTILATASGYGTPIDTGVVTPNAAARIPGRFSGNDRQQLLLGQNGYWHLLSYTGSAFTVVNTGLAVSGEFAAVDYDGDGLPDLASASGTDIRVRRNVTVPPGVVTFAAPETILSIPSDGGSGQAHAYRSRATELDFNGDGKGDLVVSYVFNFPPYPPIVQYYTLQSNGFGSFPTLIPASATGLQGDWNADGCTDWTAGGINLSDCAAGASTITYSSLGGATLLADWDGDGRVDLLSVNPSNKIWYVQRSTGEGIAAAVSTGISAPDNTSWFVFDQNGDGLVDLGFVDGGAGNAVKYHLHNAATLPPDLATAFVDGFGISHAPSYRPLSVSHHTKYADAVFPEQDYQGALYVVDQVTTSNGVVGQSYQNQFWYYGARVHVQGRGFEGFAAQRIWDSRTGLYTYDYVHRTFPYTGMPMQRQVYQSNGSTFVSTSASTLTHQVSGGAGYERRYFPFVQSRTDNEYEFGGTLNGQLVTQTTTNTSYADGYGNPTQVVTSITDKDPYSPFFNATWQTTLSRTFSNSTSYNCLGLPLTASLTKGVPDQTTQTRAYGFQVDSSACRVWQQTVEPSIPSQKVTTTLGFDTCGNVNSVQIVGANPNGTAMPARTTATGHGTRCQLPETVTNALGQTTSLSYNYDFGVPSQVTDPNTIATSWQYDDFGRPTRESRPDGTRTDWTYSYCSTSVCWGVSGLRFLVSEYPIASNGTSINTRYRFYDGLDRLRYDESYQVLGTWTNEVFFYDSLDRLITRFRPYSSIPTSILSWAYDPLGRVTSAKLYSSYSTLDRSTSFAYAGRTTTVTDPLSRVSQRVADVTGSLRRVIDPSPGGTTCYDYDVFGNLNRIQDPMGAVSTGSFNLRGFRTQWNDSDRGPWSFSGNSLNELVGWTDAKGQAFSATYDLLGRMTTRTEPEGTSTFNWGTSQAARNIGSLESMSGYGYAENRTYDSIGRLSKRSITTDQQYDYDYTYNNIGALYTVTYPASPVPSGQTGPRFRIQYGYSYGVPNVIYDTTNYPFRTLWSLNTANDYGSPLTETLGTAPTTTSVTSTYKPWTNELTSLRSGVGTGLQTNRQNLAYQWDTVGNLTQRQDLNQSKTEIFTYDGLDRLRSSRLNGIENFTATYDTAGNIRSKLGVGSYSYYDPTHKNRVSVAGTIWFSHDANGNVITRKGLSQTWASFNLPTVLRGTFAGTNYQSQFWYGPSHQRWKQIATYTNGTETTLYIGGLLEKMAATSTGLTYWRHYVPTPSGLTAIVSRNSNGTFSTTFALSDHFGSADAMLNGDGSLATQASFDAYGARRGSDWSSATAPNWTAIGNTSRHGFTWHEMLDNVGLTHMNGRVYDPVIGRFLSVDPIIGNLAGSQSVNPYAYVGNRPLSYTDPTGFEAAPCDLTCNAIIWGVRSFFGFVIGLGGSKPTPPPATALPGISAQNGVTMCGPGNSSPVCTGQIIYLGSSGVSADRNARSHSPGVGGPDPQDPILNELIVDITVNTARAFVPGYAASEEGNIAFRKGNYVVGVCWYIVVAGEVAITVATVGQSAVIVGAVRAAIAARRTTAVVRAADVGLELEAAAARGTVEGIGFARSQLQHAFKHAKDFGVSGNSSNRTLAQFSSAINSHVSAPGTRAIQGTFRGTPVTHHVDPSTGLNVIRDSSGNFLSGWRLSPQQLEHVLTTGRLGGGP